MWTLGEKSHWIFDVFRDQDLLRSGILRSSHLGGGKIKKPSRLGHLKSWSSMFKYVQDRWGLRLCHGDSLGQRAFRKFCESDCWNQMPIWHHVTRMLTILLKGEFDIVWSEYMRQPKLGGGFIYSKLFKYASNVHENYERLASFTIFFGYQMGWPKTTWLLFLCLFGLREISLFRSYLPNSHIQRGCWKPGAQTARETL